MYTKIRVRSDPAKDLSKILRTTRKSSERLYFFRALSFDKSAKQQVDTSYFPHPLKQPASSVLTFLECSYYRFDICIYAYELFNGSDPNRRYEAGKRVF